MLNNVVDILKEDFSATTEEASHLTEPKETTMKEFQSFTDLVYGKAKAVACIQWSPFEKAVPATTSYMECYRFFRTSLRCRIWILRVSNSDPKRMDIQKSSQFWNGKLRTP